MLSPKQGNYWYDFYNIFGMLQSLTGDQPALYHQAIKEAVKNL